MLVKIKDFAVRTQKATAAMLAAATAVSAATWLPLPDPWRAYVAAAVVILTWVVPYAVPFVQKVAETFRDEEVADVFEGDIIDPQTEEIPAVSGETAGIPVIEGESTP